MNKGKLYLIPVPLGENRLEHVLPPAVCERAKTLTHFIAENAKSARAFLKSLPSNTPLKQIEICELNEHTLSAVLPAMLAPLHAGLDTGLISEAGCPAVADPGAALIALAHEEQIEVFPMVGPSSILLALMGSGLSGQNFAFHGYLPAKGELRQKRLKDLEKDSRQEHRTQIFIETPYRNRQMLEALLAACAPATRICVATDLTLSTECLMTRTTAQWRAQEMPLIDRRPTVFLLQA